MIFDKNFEKRNHLKTEIIKRKSIAGVLKNIKIPNKKREQNRGRVKGEFINWAVSKFWFSAFIDIVLNWATAAALLAPLNLPILLIKSTRDRRNQSLS